MRLKPNHTENMNTPAFHIIRSHPIHWNGRDYEARYRSDDDRENAWFALCSDPDDSDTPEFPEIDESEVIWPAELLPHVPPSIQDDPEAMAAIELLKTRGLADQAAELLRDGVEISLSRLENAR
jgi:hypothetical protein